MARVVTIPIGPLFMGGGCRGLIHVIKQGDTLYKLGKQYHVSVSSIMYANPYVNIYNLQIGDELCIPVAPPRPVPVQPMPLPARPIPLSPEPQPEVPEEMSRTIPQPGDVLPEMSRSASRPSDVMPEMSRTMPQPVEVMPELPRSMFQMDEPEDREI